MSASTPENFLGVWFSTVNYAVQQIPGTYSSYATKSLYLFKSNPLSLEPLTSTIVISTCVTINNLGLDRT